MKKLRSFSIGLVIMMVAVLVVPFIVPGPGGKPFMNVDRAKRIWGDGWPQVRQAKEMIRNAARKLRTIGNKVTTRTKSKHTQPNHKPPTTISMDQDNNTFDVQPNKRAETLYKWRGKDGAWRFTNKPPPEGVHYTVVQWTSPSP